MVEMFRLTKRFPSLIWSRWLGHNFLLPLEGMVLLEEVAKVWRKDYFDDLMEVNFGDNMFLDSSMISIPRSNVWIGRLY